ncbi:MAG: translation initiation factor IF-2 [Phycisphaerae bacterium]
MVGEMLREWRDRDLIERRERLDHASGRGIMGLRADETQRGRAGEPGARQSTARKERVQLTEPIVIKAFCAATGIAFNHVFRKLQEMGTMAGMNQAIDGDTAALIALEHGVEVEIVKPRSALERLADEFAARPRPKLGPRPPVVTVLGHVDHGKTSLLDRIRKSNVAAGEAGGITQHIGAYQVSVEGRHVTFLDTPGHEAFTAMRARGAQVTDVVVLVVAADDGVMPQTVEAINHARAAKVPIVVALNKIDLPQADDQKVFGQLSEHQLVPQEWGGETDVIKTSATTGKGVDELLQHLATLTDLLELKADATVPASGTVIEAQRSDKHGIVARVLVQEGTLKPGSIIACGNAFGRVRALNDSRGRRIKEAGPSTPVELFGLSDVPAAGDKFFEVDSLATAEGVADEVSAERRAASQIKISKPTTLESVLATTAEGRVPDLNVIIKADVQGSVDVLKKALGDLPSSEVKLNILHAGVGNVTESDIALAEASDAIIVGFHVVPDPTIQRAADDRGVEIRTYRIIYELSDDIRKALEGLLEPTEKVESRGRAEVREVFNITKVGRVAGCMVRDGIIARSHLVRVLRDGVPIKDKASLASLKRFKDDAREVRAGLECGLRIDGFDDVKPGDVIEAYEVTKVSRRL